MPRTIDSNIVTALAEDAVYFVDCVEWTMPGGVRRFSQYSFDEKIANPSMDSITAGQRPSKPKTPWTSPDGKVWLNYVTGISALTWAIGPESASTTITFANVEARDANNRPYFYFKRLITNNILENTTIAIHRVFPNTAGGTEWCQNYWFGHVTGYVLTQDELRVEVQYGFAELNRRAFRKFTSTCSNCFADGLLCPYAPKYGTGLPQAYRNSTEHGTISSVNGNTITVSGATFTSNPRRIQKGHLLFIADTKACGTVVAVTPETIEVDGWTETAPDVGDHYLVGPVFKRCQFSKTACVERGMFGPNDTQVAFNLNSDARRYMSTQLIPTSAEYQGHKPSTGPGRRFERYRRTPEANDGLDGNVIPVVVGDFVFNCDTMIATASQSDSLNEQAYFDALYVIGEGRVKNIAVESVGSIVLDEVPKGTHTGVEYKNALVTWGTSRGIEVNTDGYLSEEQIKMGIGNRAAWCYYTGRDGTIQGDNEAGIRVDQYEHNPYLFSNSRGDGPSLSGFAAVRVRAQLNEAPLEGNSLRAVVQGIHCRDINDSWKWQVNPVEFAYEFMRNARWGMGLSATQIDSTAITNTSDYCDEIIGDTQSESGDWTVSIAGTVAQHLESDLDPRSQIVVVGITETEAQKFKGGKFIIPSAGCESTIIGAVTVDTAGGGGDYVDDPLSGIQFNLDPPLPGEYADSVDYWDQGTTVRLSNSGNKLRTTRRYQANGKIGSDVSCAEALQSILDNCDGTYYQWGLELKVVIPRKLTSAEESALSSKLLITDQGTDPSVVFRNGKSTVEWHPYMTDQSFNVIEVDFVDKDNDWQSTTIPVPNEDAISLMSEIYGNSYEARLTKGLSLSLTTTRDQMARIANRRMLRKGMMFDAWRNGEIKFELPVHHAMALEPVSDVLRISSKHLPNWFSRCRIMKIEESEDRVNCKITAIPYRPEQYTDQADLDFGKVFTGDSVNQPYKAPLYPVYIRSVEDVGYYDETGERKERVKLTIGVPYDPRPTTR